MYNTPSYNMFTEGGNEIVGELVEQARELAGVDGPHNAVEQAWNWLVNELDRIAEVPGYEEAADTAVREAAYDRFI